ADRVLVEPDAGQAGVLRAARRSAARERRAARRRARRAALLARGPRELPAGLQGRARTAAAQRHAGVPVPALAPRGRAAARHAPTGSAAAIAAMRAAADPLKARP